MLLSQIYSYGLQLYYRQQLLHHQLNPQERLVMGFHQQEAFLQIGVAAQRRNLVRQEVEIVTEILIVKEILSVEVIIAENSASTGERLQIAVMVYIIKFNIHILRMWSIFFKAISSKSYLNLSFLHLKLQNHVMANQK